MRLFLYLQLVVLIIAQNAWSQQGTPAPVNQEQRQQMPQPQNQRPQQVPQQQNSQHPTQQPQPMQPQQMPQQPSQQQQQPTQTSSTATQISAIEGLEGLHLKSEAAGRRDPFTLPLYLINKIKEKNVGPPVSRVDESVEPIRRWPLVSYTLVGIIWDVKNAKALIRDQAGKVHILKVKDRIGYDKGVITDIREGSITVLENEVPQVLKLRK